MMRGGSLVVGEGSRVSSEHSSSAGSEIFFEYKALEPLVVGNESYRKPKPSSGSSPRILLETVEVGR
jgi:hypothetical protein